MFDKIAEELVQRRGAVALTGAGISVDSGIPDFRSPGGFWERFDPMEYATIQAFQRDPRKVWRMLIELERILSEAEPNPGHRALARLERDGVLNGIITQNVDNLHQAAGSTSVVEFHGNGRRLVCPACGAGHAAPATVREAPECSCGEILKPDVVFFGEMIPAEATRRATELVQRCKVMIVVGTSATVAPASLLPITARRGGAVLVEVNLEPTELTAACDYSLLGGASEELPRLAEEVARRITEPR